MARLWDRILVRLGMKEADAAKRPWLVDCDGRVHTDAKQIVLKARR